MNKNAIRLLIFIYIFQTVKWYLLLWFGCFSRCFVINKEGKTNDHTISFVWFNKKKSLISLYIFDSFCLYQTIGTKGVQEIFLWIKSPWRWWIVLVSRWCCQSGPLKVIGQFSLNGFGCKTLVKFVIGHWSVSIHLLLVRSVCSISVC